MSLVRVLGVRHHGPGSARAVRAALERFDPQVVLVEGPADADPLVTLTSDGMTPPVALLAYADDDPGISSFWPFAVFSPEWQAIRWAQERGVPVRFMDLPSRVVLARKAPGRDPSETAEGTAKRADHASESEAATPTEETTEAGHLHRDPIAVLAHVAGYDDPERWWDDVVESQRDDAVDVFDAVTDAMRALREADPGSAATSSSTTETEMREAHMRQVLRATLKSGTDRVAVVCGAWHAPALTLPLPPANRDTATLRGLPKRKTVLTWIPWTHGRLSYASGYGAGVVSPGWSAHLFTTPEQPIADWLTRVAAVLRAEDLPISSAHVIEAVRLAETLAVLRGRPLAGLAEVTEATRSVICDGNEAVLDLVTRRLVVGEALGEVPENTPTVPLENDLAATNRRLRLKRSPTPATKDLDLRKPTDAERSRLLHRLALLGIPWGKTTTSQVRSTGTFRESWELIWRPEYAVDVVEASMWGTTVRSATVAKVCSDALGAGLSQLTALVETALLADLGDALPDLLGALDTRAAHDHDIAQLMAALPPLVRSVRYGDVRDTDTAALATVADTLLVRICAGLTTAVTSLDDAGARQMRGHIDAVHDAVALRADDASRDQWLDVLSRLVDRADVHGLLSGRMVRLLLDAGQLSATQAGDRLARALSVGSPPPEKAAWVEGFLSGSGLLLVHDTALLALVDEWVRQLRAEDFLDALPLLRRTFGAFTPPERRSIGESVRHLGDAGPAAAGTTVGWDPDRAAAALETATALLGLGPIPPRLTGGAR